MISSYHDYRKPIEVSEPYRHRANRGRLISWKFLRSISTQQIFNDVMAMPFLSTYQTFDTSRLAKYTDRERTRAAIKHPINVYSVVYETVDPHGNVTSASGAVLVPQGINRPVPLYGLQRGTIYYDLDAPSYGEMTTWGIWRALIPTSAGYVAAMADYLGFGASRHILHPYPMARPNAVAVVDLLRATRTLTRRLGVSLKDQVFLQGMSEGGQATLATQREVETHHAREFKLVASAPGAASANVSSLMKTVLGSDKIIAPQIFSLALMSYNETYRMNRPLTDFFKQPYADLIPELHNLEHGNDYISNHLPKGNTADLYNGDFLRQFSGDGEEALKKAFRENDLHVGWTPRTQTRIYHGTADEIIPFATAKSMYEGFVKNGANVSLISIEGALHIDSMLPITLLSVEWFNQLRTQE